MTISLRLFRWHWGDPDNPTEIRSWTGAFDAAENGEDVAWKHCFTSQRLKRWFGLSYNAEVFFGVCVFRSSFSYRSSDPPAFPRALQNRGQDPGTHVNARKDGSEIERLEGKMAYRNPHKTLAQQLESALQASRDPKTRVALYLTREEWALVIKTQISAAAPPAPRKKRAAPVKPEEGDHGG